MSNGSRREAMVKLNPLILRLALAGIMVTTGWNALSGQGRPGEPAVPPPVEPSGNPVATLEPPAATLAEAGSAVPVGQPVSPAPAALDSSGLRLNLDWNTLLGVGQLGFAGLLLVGFLTRLVVLVPLLGVGWAGATAHGVTAGTGQCARLTGMYESNPTAFLLLGAICLALLVSGSGPLGLDGAIFRRKRAAKSAAEPAAM